MAWTGELAGLLTAAGTELTAAVATALGLLDAAVWRSAEAESIRAAARHRRAISEQLATDLALLALRLGQPPVGPAPGWHDAGPAAVAIPRAAADIEAAVLLDPVTVAAAAAGFEVAAERLGRLSGRLDELVAPGPHRLTGGEDVDREVVIAVLVAVEPLVDELVAVAGGLADDAATLRAAVAGVRACDRWHTGRSAAGRLPPPARLWNRMVEEQVVMGVTTAATVADTTGLLVDLVVRPRSTAVALVDGSYREGPDGDRGGTFETRAITGAAGQTSADPAERGRAAVRQLLARTADGSGIADDEFQLVDHGGARFTVILPGVVDLTDPTAGLHPVHRSVRDLDRFAVRSAFSTGTDGNRYAGHVAAGLAAAGVPEGAELLVVGHSYGADTALDLAADPVLNGCRYRITHVVAAAYHSQPQLGHVPAGTEVLVLQNRRDLIVGVESLLDLAVVDEPPPPDGAAPLIHSFDGGLGLDLGHHQDRYLGEVSRVDDPAIDAFFRSIDATGYSGGGSAVAVDVSV